MLILLNPQPKRVVCNPEPFALRTSWCQSLHLSMHLTDTSPSLMSAPNPHVHTNSHEVHIQYSHYLNPRKQSRCDPVDCADCCWYPRNSRQDSSIDSSFPLWSTCFYMEVSYPLASWSNRRLLIARIQCLRQICQPLSDRRPDGDSSHTSEYVSGFHC